MGIAVDEINKFLLRHEMMIYLVVFDTKSTELALRLQPALDAYIDHLYVCEKREEEYGDRYFASYSADTPGFDEYCEKRRKIERQTTFHVNAMMSAPKKPEKKKSDKKRIFSIWKKESSHADDEIMDFKEAVKEEGDVTFMNPLEEGEMR